MYDIEAEYEVFGVNHLEVGEHIAKLWKLPEDLTKIIGHHNYPSQLNSSRELVAIVRFADILCELWGAGIYEGFKAVELSQTEPWLILCESFPELADLDIEIFTFELEEEFIKSSQFLNLIVGSSK